MLKPRDRVQDLLIRQRGRKSRHASATTGGSVLYLRSERSQRVMPRVACTVERRWREQSARAFFSPVSIALRIVAVAISTMLRVERGATLNPNRFVPADRRIHCDGRVRWPTWRPSNTRFDRSRALVSGCRVITTRAKDPHRKDRASQKTDTAQHRRLTRHRNPA
jgi:hypothetical protein